MGNTIRKSGRLLVFATAAVVLGPAMLVGAALAALSIVHVWFSDVPGGLLDSLFAGPSAPLGTFGSYVSFMIGAMVASG